MPEGKPGNESGELAVCTETRHEQIQNQRKRTKKISAAAADFILAGKQAEFAHSTQAKEHEQCRAEQQAAQIKKLLQAEFAHSTQAKEHKQCRAAGGA